MIVKDKHFFNDYIKVWDNGAVKDAPFITLGLEAVLTDYYGNLLDAPPPFAVKTDEQILDLGCGWGRVLKPVRSITRNAVGLDISQQMLIAAKNHCNYHHLPTPLVGGDGTSLPFKDNTFDTVYSLLVLQHLSKDNGKKVIKEIHRVLKPGGAAYIRVPSRFAPENLLMSFLQIISINVFRYKDPIRMRFYRIGEIKKICNSLFSDVEITAHEFRPPWNFHTPWTWHYIIIPRRYHKRLRAISDAIEKKANTTIPWLKHFAVTLMIKAVK
ncbi:MAG: class I SAM-dependent methyltransferase [Spirochaetes bacterium]|nr:class I SAM-dependent methyltransferase [Spirochaetota bacterium]